MNGFKGVTNRIKSKNHFLNKKKDMENVTERICPVNKSDINISVFGTTVTFIGKLNSWYHNRVGWKASVDWLVNKELTVVYKYAHS